MGRRREKIFEELTRQCGKLDKKTLMDKSGVTASDIAESLDIMRSNVSSELNQLVREKRVVKFVTRPVLYLPAELVHSKLGVNVHDYEIKSASLKEAVAQDNDSDSNTDPFAHLIGAAGSLKSSVKQARSAIVYPPRGLHTLILGPTGSGKTLFAHMMFNYAKSIGRIKEDAPFIDFNCADYFNNPQLLIGQLFGYVKGAFTGAVRDQEGLVAKADGGILFLDEIHRLPPEGQEMLFYFMDNGRFSKLGETGNKRESHVLIIAATTADPESALLQTFLRRIPVMIKIPEFQSRTVDEQVELTKFLLSREAHRTHHKFHVSSDVIKALSGSLLGPLLFFVGINLVRFLTRWYGFKVGYEQGTDIVQDVAGNRLKKLTQMASVLGLFVMGSLVSKWTSIKMPLAIVSYHQGGKLITTSLQNILDSLLPGLVALLMTFGCMWLLKHKVNAIWIIFGMFAVGIFGYWIGLFGL